MYSPSAANNGRDDVLRARLRKCWQCRIDWNGYPKNFEDGCKQFAKAISVPVDAVVAGLLLLTSFFIAPALVKSKETGWTEPVVLWQTVCMSTGSRKSALYKLLSGIVKDVKKKLDCQDNGIIWKLEDCSFEKMGDLMARNGGRLLALNDEFSSFLSHINVFHGKSLTDNHELGQFLELFNGDSWTRETVSGDANFTMDTTSLIVGGFNQPAVARSLIELPRNAEKGLSQRFLWLFPKPMYSKWKDLAPIDKVFYDDIVSIFASLWREPIQNETINPRIYDWPYDSKNFVKKYDSLQEKLEKLDGADDLLAGMLSKLSGQTLRVAACFHVLFGKSDAMISDEAIDVAMNFVDVCCQQTAYIAGRGEIDKEIELVVTGGVRAEKGNTMTDNLEYCLLLPGKILYLSPLLEAKKFRYRNHKKGALQAMRTLEQEGLGLLEEVGTSKGPKFRKAPVPDNVEDKQELAEKLMKHNVSLLEYTRQFHQPNFEKKHKLTEEATTASPDPKRRKEDEDIDEE